MVNRVSSPNVCWKCRFSIVEWFTENFWFGSKWKLDTFSINSREFIVWSLDIIGSHVCCTHVKVQKDYLLKLVSEMWGNPPSMLAPGKPIFTKCRHHWGFIYYYFFFLPWGTAQVQTMRNTNTCKGCRCIHSLVPRPHPLYKGKGLRTLEKFLYCVNRHIITLFYCVVVYLKSIPWKNNIKIPIWRVFSKSGHV